MRMFKTISALLLALGLSQQSHADVQEIQVDGSVEFFNESFDPSTHPRDNDGWWNGPIFSYVFVCPAGVAKCNKFSMVQYSGNHFISSMYFFGTPQDKDFFGTGGGMSRRMRFKLTGRDPSKTYRIVATQKYDLKTPDIRKTSPVIGGNPERKVTKGQLLINCAGGSLRFSAGNWSDNSSIGEWKTNMLLTSYAQVGPADCPSNDFWIIFDVDYAQDVSLGTLDVMSVEENPL